MKRFFWSAVASALMALALPPPTSQAQVPAVVIADRINVRSRPSVVGGEVVTQLTRGQRVIVFEEGLPAASPKEPVTEWSRVELPAGTPVWVSADHVSMPAGTVKPKRLNVRSGPSEDYGVLGTVAEGTGVRVLQERNGWLQIEAPLGLFVFVASTFLDAIREPSADEAASPPPASPLPSPSRQSPDTSPPSAPAEESARVTEPESMPAPADDLPQPPVNTLPAEPNLSAPPLDSEEISPQPRIVRREGMVRATLSIQAPTPFELRAADNGKLLNYLVPQSSNVLIRPFRGQHVFITGEEYIEPLWRTAPVILVHEIKLAP